MIDCGFHSGGCFFDVVIGLFLNDIPGVTCRFDPSFDLNLDGIVTFLESIQRMIAMYLDLLTRTFRLGLKLEDFSFLFFKLLAQSLNVDVFFAHGGFTHSFDDLSVTTIQKAGGTGS